MRWISTNSLGLAILVLLTILAVGMAWLGLRLGRLQRIASWFASAAFLASALGYGLAHFTDLNAEILANIWVAAGTMLLGVVTALSVYETTAVIRSEDKRHTQDNAPLLILEHPFIFESNAGPAKATFALSNIGKGIALNADVSLLATVKWFLYQHQNIDAGQIDEYRDKGFSIPDLEGRWGQIPVTKRDEQLSEYPLTFHVDAVADRMQTLSLWIEDQSIADTFLPADSEINFSGCQLHYTDVFGNRYKTVYTDGLKRYRWERPVSLR